MDYDKLKNLPGARIFDAELRKKGTSFDEVVGGIIRSRSPSAARQLEVLEKVGAPSATIECVKELLESTDADDVEEIITRALGIYRSIVRHVASEAGSVRFVNNDLTYKTLKVPVKK